MKKKHLLSKLLIIGGIITIFLTGCSSKEAASEKDLTIGILQYVEHPALDDARNGFIDELTALGIDADIAYQNAHGDISNTIKISQKFERDQVDLIYAIGTPAAQSAKQMNPETPILFSAVTDPVDAGLVDSWEVVGGNVTGTSDKADIKTQLQMFKEIDPSIETIGIIYNTSEQNSIIQITEVEEIAPEEGLTVKVVGVNNINDLNTGLKSLVTKVDAMYILSDNLTASAVDLVSNTLIDNDMVSVSAEESQVNGGILITKSHSYYDLGKETAEIAKDILINKTDIKTLPVYLPKKQETVVNYDTLEKLSIDSTIELFKTK